MNHLIGPYKRKNWSVEAKKKLNISDDFMLHLYRPKQHVIISYSTTKWNEAVHGEKFQLIKFIAGATMCLSTYMVDFYSLSSLFSIIIIHYILPRTPSP